GAKSSRRGLRTPPAPLRIEPCGVTTPSPSREAAMPQTFPHGHALLVGVGATAYSPWSLPVTVKDAQAIQAVLTNPALCGYPAENHIRLLHDQGATRA